MSQPLNPRRWVEFALKPYPTAATTTYRWASRPLAGTFFVEGRIPVSGGWESIVRKSSSMSGDCHIDHASVLINDADGLVRGLLGDVTTQWFTNREMAFKLLSETAFASGLTPRLLFGGKCYDVQLGANRSARMEAEDILSPYLDRTYPQYTLGDAYPFMFTDPDEIDASLNIDDPGLQIAISLRDHVLPIYYGPFIDSAVDPVSGVQRSKGMCPSFFIGYTYLTAGGDLATEPSLEMAAVLATVGGTNWGSWGELFICHGEVDIPNVYVSDLTATPTRVRATADRYGTEILAPGHPDWPFATDYVMRNGFRCTVIYVRGPALWHHVTGMVNVTVDLCGWKNSDGDAIDQAGFVYQSFIAEHVLAHDGAGFTAGPETGLPTFADGRSMIWTEKVQDWQAMTADRLGTAKGYLCSMALLKPTPLREILKTWHITFDAFSAKNGAGQLYPFSIDDLADPTAGVPIRERIELTSLPAPRIAWDEIENDMDYTLGYDPEQDAPRTPTLNLRDEPAIAALGVARKVGVRHLAYTADDATATDVTGRRLMRLKDAPRYQPLAVRVDGVDREIGEQVLVTHRDGFGAGGYVLQPMTILEHEMRGHAITLRAFDVSRILESASRWASDAIPDWDSASAAEQTTYGFWANADDTLGAGNDPATEWR